MLKYVTKFAMDLLPSVIATIIGAYIVNHYIVTKPGAGAPVAAAVSSADPKKAAAGDDAQPSGKSVDVANLPEPGVKAKGISEKAALEKSATEKPAVVEKPAEKSADKPAETASIPTDVRRHQPVASREKAVAKSAPVAVAAPVVAAPNTAPPVEAVVTPEEHRDANDLARAAIERLRAASDGATRTQEAVRIPDAPRVATAPPVAPPPFAATPIRPLPPPIMVSAPSAEAPEAATSTQVRPASPATDGAQRPIPPADIPMAASSSRPLDLRADATDPPVREHKTVAEDMLSAAKSVFHAVLPK